jgi:ABC-type uncharacterized transport system permease subunit
MIGRISGLEMVEKFGIQLFWILVLGALFSWGWRQALRRYSAAGA